MRFIALVKFKKNPREFVAENLKMIEKESKKGIKYLSINWTLGRYDAVAMFEAPNEKEAMQLAIRRADFLDMETLVAIPAEEARKLVD
ncbi:MAG: GYD domain-containing protein [Methanoregula sp.]|nr:GYD domain-containing protein [Methanoregula sp.]